MMDALKILLIWQGVIVLVVVAAKYVIRHCLWTSQYGKKSHLWGTLILTVVLLAVYFRLLGVSTWSVAVGSELVIVTYFFLAKYGPKTGLADWQERKRRKEVNRQAWLHVALGSGALVFILPFLWLVSTSLKFDDQMKAFPPQFIPTKAETIDVDGQKQKVYFYKGQKVWISGKAANGETELTLVEGGTVTVPADMELDESRYFRPRWENFTEALEFLPPEYKKGLVPLGNTLYITTLSILGLLFSSSLVAYSFARLRWPGRDLFFIILLATMMLPPAVTMLPVFLIFRSLGWIDTLRPLWFPAFLGSAFNIFLLRQFFMTIPMELEEAAKIDGASPFTTYWRIMLPLVKPALAAVTIMAFMGSWNNFMGPLIYINSPEKMPLSYALYLFQGMHGGEQGLMMAAATLVMLPVLLVFFFTQRYFIQGITLTGLGGK